MDIVFAIIAFALFGVITDAIEGWKKKRQMEIPKRKPVPAGQTKAKKSRDIIIPPIVGAPNASPKQPPPPPFAALANRPRPTLPDVVIPAVVESQQPLRTADIHSDVLLSAVAYAQILQPPKAYQYMATGSVRGDWQNQR